MNNERYNIRNHCILVYYMTCANVNDLGYFLKTFSVKFSIYLIADRFQKRSSQVKTFYDNDI